VDDYVMKADYKELESPSLKHRRAVSDMVEIFKHLNHYEKSCVPKKFNQRIRPMRTHNSELVRIFGNDGVRGPQSNSLHYRGIQQWNSLPEKVVKSSTIQEFKENLGLAWKEKMFEYD